MNKKIESTDTNTPKDQALENPEMVNENSNAIVPAKRSIPKKMHLVVIGQRPIFPNMVVPLVIDGELFANTVKTATKEKPSYLGIVLGKDNFNIENFDQSDLFKIGVATRIVKSFYIGERQAQVLLDALTRIKITKIEKSEDGILATVEAVEEEETVEVHNDSIKAYCREILSNLKELIRLNPLVKEELNQFINQVNIEDPHRLADFAAALTSAGRFELQEILETVEIQKRLEKTLLLVKKELDLGRLQAKISQQIEERISKNQREFFLKEQLKEIRKELGLTKDEKSQETEKFIKRAKRLKLSDEAKKVFNEEINKINLLDPQSPEYNVSRNYLDWITSLPWGIYQKENTDLAKAERILNEDHFGLHDIKDKILDLIASMKLRKNISGGILCLVGPPGVGKTSIGKSLARALNRPFFRFSLGGMRDEAEIKGHRRTYIGAMPGKFIQALKNCGKANAIIMLDEIDKLGRSYAGDPASALLEALDKEQNSKFLDHYLDLPFDLSKVLFIGTANQTDTIPEALKDRMNVIHLSGYIMSEKIEIASRYLIKKQKKETGLANKKVELSQDAIEKIIESYARESGVRNLEKMIEKIFRSVARKYLNKEIKTPVVITAKDVETYLKAPIFIDDEIIGAGKAGCINGLAWTNYGGSILTIEAADIPSQRRGFKQTGQLGKVMVESSEIAYSYVLANAQKFKLSEKQIENKFIHLHVPAGATPKDGPSAGIAMALAIVSLLSNKPVKQKLGMTGELSLTGEVLRIGGLKEKIIAAQRSKLKNVIIPKSNKRDFEEIPDNVKKGINYHFVSNFNEVFDLSF